MSRKDFADVKRIDDVYRPAEERRRDFRDVERRLRTDEVLAQSKRCMDCGIPFCHGAGCPLGNVIPEMNAAVRAGDWHNAWNLLSSTSPMPEFTARVCPALCEGACTAGIDFGAVMVRQIEKAVVETAFAEGWIKPEQPKPRNGKHVAVAGAGPAGLAAAIELNRRGFSVTVFERNEKPGGLLRYGIPEFKLEKHIIDRRIDVMEKSGIRFLCGAEIGRDIAGSYLTKQYDAVLVAAGTPAARDLPIPGRELSGIHFALDYFNGDFSAEGKRVLVIGGGDTGSDCVGTAIRQNAKSVLQIEIMPKPPAARSERTPWPDWPYLLRTSSSHKEGGERRWNLRSVRFTGDRAGAVRGVDVAEADAAGAGGVEVIETDFVLLAMGFLKPEPAAMLKQMDFAADAGNVFVAGDAANGPSLVVRAIADALSAVEKIDEIFRSRLSF